METIARHPLEAVSAGREQAPPPPEDQTPPSFPNGAMPLARERLKREVGRHVYPFKNRVERPIVERRLRAAGVELGARRRPEVLTWGNKGMGVEIFLAEARRRIGPVNRAICFGSGMGTELLNVAKIVRPKQILAFEYMNYRRAWDWVVREVSALGVEARFVQRDLRNAVGAAPGEPGDVLFSFTVLEHLRDMRESFGHLRSLIRPDGWFAAHWGPMWNSYGGDHIAPEVGFDHGYDQLLLSTSEYLSFYRTHPRNIEHVKSGRPTWLELGLSNFAAYDEYITEIERNFGGVRWLAWCISQEGWQWRSRHPGRWIRMLQSNPHLSPLDLLLTGASVLTKGSPSV